jgi:hypothetical protein
MNPRTPRPEGRDPLSSILARWMADSAPHAVSDRTLDAVTAATATAPQRGRRGPWLAVLATAAAAAAVAAIAVVAFGLVGRGVGEVVPSASASPTATAAATDSPTPSPTQSPSPSPSPIAETPADEPEASNEPLLRLVEGCDVIPEVSTPRATVMRDGRMVWLSGVEPPDPQELTERRLSAAGLDAIRTMVEETGAFDADGDYPFVRRADAPEGPGHGFCVYTFTYAPPDGEPVTVTSAMWFGDDVEATYFEPSPVRKALDDLARVLRDPEDALAADAWDDATSRPYLAAEFLVVASLGTPQFAEPGAPDVDELAWPFAEPPDAFGELAGIQEGGSPTRCDVATRDAMAPLIDQLLAVGYEQFAEPFTGASTTSPWLPWSSRSNTLLLLIAARHPDGAPGCDDVN